MQKRGANHWLSKKHDKDYKKGENWIRCRQATGESHRTRRTNRLPQADELTPNQTTKMRRDEEKLNAVNYNDRQTSGERENRTPEQAEAYLNGYAEAEQELARADGQKPRTKKQILNMMLQDRREHQEDKRKQDSYREAEKARRKERKQDAAGRWRLETTRELRNGRRVKVTTGVTEYRTEEQHQERVEAHAKIREEYAKTRS